MSQITVAEAFNQLAKVAEAGRIAHATRLQNGDLAFQVDTPEFEWVEIRNQEDGTVKAYASK